MLKMNEKMCPNCYKKHWYLRQGISVLSCSGARSRRNLGKSIRGLFLEYVSLSVALGKK